MDSIRVSKVRFVWNAPLICSILRVQVERVLCGKSGGAHYGSLHLTAHHLIFRYEDAEKEEMWASPTFGSMLHAITRIAGTLPADISRNEAPADLAWTESANLSHSDV
jgi:hypothetical protein